MQKSTARSYIEKRVRQASTDVSYYFARFTPGFGKYSELYARRYAQHGDTAMTASHLCREGLVVNRLTVPEKATILAEAYTGAAERSLREVKYFELPYFLENHQSEADRLRVKHHSKAKRSSRIAQGLTRSAQRLQN